MAHLRERLLTDQLRKQLKFWPIVTLLGPRQSGKSTFLRELAFRGQKFGYVSLDRLAARSAAEKNPEAFLAEQGEADEGPQVIDEAHKAPALFDEIKASVDEDRRPGRFVLSGSVRFSSRLGIRESFTGRSAQLLFDSMTLPETLGKSGSEVSLAEVQRYLKQGGMPGVCFLRDRGQIERYWSEWLETVCSRDLQEQGRGGSRLSGDLAFQILEQTALLPFPGVAEIAAQLRVDSRRIKTHIEALESIFLLRRWEPDRDSVGKTLFLPFDCGMAAHLGAPLIRLCQTWVAHHWLNSERFRGVGRQRLLFNLTARKSFVDFVFESERQNEALLFCDDPYPSAQMGKRIAAVAKRLPHHKIRVLCQTEQPAQKIAKSAWAVPWSWLMTHQG